MAKSDFKNNNKSSRKGDRKGGKKNGKDARRDQKQKQKPKRRQATASSKSWNTQASHKTHKNKREVVFDPEARKSYLRGFSERKRQRRAFGLAMQKVKDRQSKIDQRAQEKKDVLERVQQAESQKEELMEEYYLTHNPKAAKEEDDSDNEDDSDGSDQNNSDSDSADDQDVKEKKSKQRKATTEGEVIDTKVYHGKTTETTWGGQVTVSTSVINLDDDEDEEDGSDGDSDNDTPSAKKKQKSVDVAQKYAGNVQRYLNELKGNMPGKHKTDTKARRKGKNGMADMKGVGGSGNFKIASKLLAKSQDRNAMAAAGGGKKKGKKGRR